MMLETTLPAELWVKAFLLAKWLRNIISSSRITFEITLQQRDQKAKLHFRPITEFGAPGYPFIYYSISTKAKKLLPRSEAAHFLGVEENQKMIRVYVPETKTIHSLRHSGFHLNRNSPLPSLSALLDGISRKHIIEEKEMQPAEQTEEILQSSLASLHIYQKLITQLPFSLTSRLVPYKLYLGINDGHQLPQSFQTACKQT